MMLSSRRTRMLVRLAAAFAMLLMGFAFPIGRAAAQYYPPYPDRYVPPPTYQLKIPLISDEAINIGKSWLFEEELTELFHERPQAILPHGRDELIMQATLAEQRMDTSLGCAGL